MYNQLSTCGSHIFYCKQSRLLLGQPFISFIALAGSLPHLTQISNEIKAIQKMKKSNCSTVSKALNIDIKYVVLVMTFWTWNNMPLVWCIYHIQDYGGKQEGMQHGTPLINSWGCNSSPKPPYKSIGQNISWTGFLLCFTNYGENTIQMHLAHCANHFSYKPDYIFLSKLIHMKHLVFAWQ